MKLRVDKDKPLYRFNIFINRDIANKVRAQAVLEDKTVERFIEDALAEKVNRSAVAEPKMKPPKQYLREL